MKTQRNIFVILFILTLIGCHKSASVFKPNHESLTSNYTYPEWFCDAKFGIYTHWGPSTYANQYNERIFGWYGRLMYDSVHPAFKYHQKHFGNQHQFGYKDIIKKFTAEKFNAEEWAKQFADAGAKFAGPVAVHHDNFLMWKSDISPWNAHNIGPQRDITAELEKAIRAQGMKFMGSFHHGFTYRFFENAYLYDGAEAPLLYGPERQGMPKKTRDTKEWKAIPRDFQESFLAKVQEFTKKYQPDLIYYDFGMGWHDEDIKNKMYADYYNEGLPLGQHRTVAQKQREGQQLFYSTLDLERGRMAFLTEYPWLTDDSPGSWFYYPNTKLQTANTMIDRFVDIVSKNGCLLLNIGPDHEGVIPEAYAHILKEYGKWLKVNGEAIYNTRPWFTFGEGETKNTLGHHGAANSASGKAKGYSSKDIRYTRSKDGKTLYAFLLDWPTGDDVVLKSVLAGNTNNYKAELLGYGELLVGKDANDCLLLDFENIQPKDVESDHAYCVKITGDGLDWHPQGHYWLPSTIKLNWEKDTKKQLLTSSFDVIYPQRNYELVLNCQCVEDAEVGIKIIKGNQVIKEFSSVLKACNTPQLQAVGLIPFKTKGNYKVQVTSVKGTILSNSLLAVTRDETILKTGAPI
ncbi:alpha-L-fucosidase [Labilibacter sediminis]|nr:alpha-L-fucosidase [Labilibacter sediminis]